MGHPMRLFIRDKDYELLRLHKKLVLKGVKEYSIDEHELKHYLINVLRLQKGAKLSLYPIGAGESFEEYIEARLIDVSPPSLEFICEHSFKVSPPVTANVKVFVPLLKGDDTEEVVDSLVQLGVGHIGVFKAERSLPSSLSKKETRLRRKIYWASIQSRRWWLPKLTFQIDLESVIDDELRDELDMLIAATPIGKPLIEVMNELPPGLRIGLVTGPEGGFSERELSLMESTPKVRAVSLGTLILRARLAPVVLTSEVGVLIRREN